MAHLQEEHLSQILSCPQDVAFNLQALGWGNMMLLMSILNGHQNLFFISCLRSRSDLTPVSQPETSQVQLCLIQTSSHSHHSDAAPLSHSAMSPYGLLQSTFYM